MRIRPFQLSDYVAVTELLADALSDVCYEETMEPFARQLSLDSELVLVAEVDQKIVGMIIGTIDNQNGYCYRIAVHRQYRRRGIGTSLILGIKKRFKLRNVQKVFVPVDPHNEPVLPLFESMGCIPCTQDISHLRIVSG